MSASSGTIQHLKVKGLSGSQVYENWKSFLFQFRNFLLAFNHTEAKDDKKVALLLHMLGPEVIHIFQSFNQDSTKIKYDDLIQKFEGFFSPKKKMSLERNMFFSRKQKTGESIESYVTDLKVLSNTCEFKELKDSLIKDVFIVGLLEENYHIRERLLQEDDVKTLEDIVDIARTIELSRPKDKDNPISQDIMKIGNKPNSSGSFYARKFSQGRKSACGKCGLQFHTNKKCPAAKAKCHGCSKIGHYSKMCRFKHNVSTVQENCESEQSNYLGNSTYFIGSVNNIESESKGKWSVLACLNNKKEVPIRMFIDTGAEANVLSLNDFKMLKLPKSSIKETMSKLTNYGGSEIPIIGQCVLDCKINNRSMLTRFFVCDSDQPTILGLRSCENFEIIKKVCVVKENNFSRFGEYSSLMTQFSDLFTGLGCLPGESHITLKENAQPHVDPPCKVPFKLM
uniref:Peptidase A2 domain-containing protein n=1 Tax=Cacopsylla melanoneura TaxID=428564 RepID=A0A8D8T2G4_9HEMI